MEIARIARVAIHFVGAGRVVLRILLLVRVLVPSMLIVRSAKMEIHLALVGFAAKQTRYAQVAAPVIWIV
jgi:hypothetical protein